MLMKTIFSKKIYTQLFLSFLIMLIFSAIGVLILRKTQQLEKERFFAGELQIDTISDSRALGYSGQRKLVQDSAGNIFVGYRKDYQKNAEIFIAKISQTLSDWRISGTEKPIISIERNNDQRVPSLAIDAKNTLHVVWYGSDTENKKNNRQIKYSRKSSDAENWESWRNIAYVSGYENDELWQEHPMLLAGKDDTLYVAWEGKDEENEKQQIKFSKSNTGGAVWTKWKNISPSKNNTHSRPALIEDKNGKLYLFAYSSLGNEDNLQQIQYASSSDQGETWTAWQAISDSFFDSRHISVTIDKLEKIHVVWRAQTMIDGPSQIIYRNFYDDRWSEIEIVSPSENYQFFPNIGTNQSGAIYVSWMESPDPAEFPRENPTGSLGLISFLKKERFQPPFKISEKNNILYPNLSEKNNLDKFVPVFYAQQLNEKELNLKLKFFDSSK
ncbi:MAG: hypothetical protein UR65_C0011G0001 [Candidatus Moranbacteria bacterium GW2011_GWE2_35_164]|nr:MAG: hypothetical protein UR65_C0011G0001 [Candidatus Moranbacteria bacterium GW2011_GWE2_35_164]